jgi:hypothetical protein
MDGVRPFEPDAFALMAGQGVFPFSGAGVL